VRVESIERMDWKKSRAFLALWGRRRGVRLWEKACRRAAPPVANFVIQK